MSPSPPEPAPAAPDQPLPAADATTVDASPDGSPDDAETTAEAPLNRAERRARAKGVDPSHVGPRAGRTAQGRSARSHTKRQIS